MHILSTDISEVGITLCISRDPVLTHASILILVILGQ